MSEQIDSVPPSPGEALPGGNIIAQGGKYYRNTRFVLALGLLVYGGLSIRDGFFKWPGENASDLKLDPLVKPRHSDTDILFNQVLGVALPPAALLLLGWTIYNSRGRIRLSANSLSVPGHREISLRMIESVDKSKWDRKGIAYVMYRLDTGRIGKFKLDDFVYERKPIDEIFGRIEQSLTAPRQPKVAAVTAAPRAKFPPTPPRPRL